MISKIFNKRLQITIRVKPWFLILLGIIVIFILKCMNIIKTVECINCSFLWTLCICLIARLRDIREVRRSTYNKELLSQNAYLKKINKV